MKFPGKVFFCHPYPFGDNAFIAAVSLLFNDLHKRLQWLKRNFRKYANHPNRQYNF